jgi:GNAT superfamily N-acetyltransferase
MARTVVRRFVQVARNDGPVFLWFKVWGELVYRRLGLFELRLEESLPEVEARVPIVVGEWTAPDDAAVDGAGAVPTVARDEFLRRRQAGHRCFVAHREGELVGSCWMARGSMPSSYLRTDIALGPDEACSYETYIAPSARGLAIGPALRAQAARMLRDDGCRRLLATVSLENPPAIRLVEKLGYELIGRIGYLGRGWLRWDFCRVRAGACGLAQERRPAWG